MEGKPYLIAFRATSMETRSSIIEWLRIRDAVHVLADVWLVKLPQTSAGDITHSIVQYDKFGAQLIVAEIASDLAAEGSSEGVRSWIKTNLAS